MNGNSRKSSQSASSPLARPDPAVPHSPGNTSSGLIFTAASALRSLQAQNVGTLSHVIAQLETVNEIQNEVVSARAAYAQASSDLRKAVDQSLLHANQVQQKNEELRSVNLMLQAARDQMFLMERKLENVGIEAAAHERQRTAAREAEKNKQIEALSLALRAANTQIRGLNGKLESVTTAVGTIAPEMTPVLSSEAIEASSKSLSDLEKWISASRDHNDVNTTAANVENSGTASALPSATNSHDLLAESRNEISKLVKNCFQEDQNEKRRMLSQLGSLRSEFGNVLNTVQASASRASAIETAFKAIIGLNIQPAPLIPNPIAPADNDVEMDEERTEAARVARRSSTQTTPTPAPSDTQSPFVPSTMAQPPAPTQTASELPQRKRQRSSVGPEAPEPLPRDDELRGLIQLVNTAYEIRNGTSTGENGGEATSKQLVCKACDTRRKAQPDYSFTPFTYGQDGKLAVPSRQDAEQTRARVQPWIAHMQEKHQKMYTAFMKTFNAMAKAGRLGVAPST